jgi:uncharacterized protein
MNTNNKINKVKGIFKDKKVAIAFSGGADSTLLIHLAKESNADILAVTFDNFIDPSGFVEYSRKRAEDFGVKHEIIELNFFDVDEFVSNKASRCYDCRKLMYSSIKQLAKEKGYEIMVDGNNITDLIHDRPGILVKYENEVLSPFIDAGLESYEIHKYLEDNDIEYAKSTTCLATRIKTNQKVTPDSINRIDYGESFIKDLTGVDVVKLREDNNKATVEVSDLDKILDKEIISKITEELKELKYDKILLDIGIDNSEESLIKDSEIQIKENGRLRLDKSVPYKIDIENTIKIISKNPIIENIGEIKEIKVINEGLLKFEIEDKTFKLLEYGQIVFEDLDDKEEVYLYLIKILPLIRRKVS